MIKIESKTFLLGIIKKLHNFPTFRIDEDSSNQLFKIIEQHSTPRILIPIKLSQGVTLRNTFGVAVQLTQYRNLGFQPIILIDDYDFWVDQSNQNVNILSKLKEIWTNKLKVYQKDPIIFTSEIYDDFFWQKVMKSLKDFDFSLIPSNNESNGIFESLKDFIRVKTIIATGADIITLDISDLRLKKAIDDLSISKNVPEFLEERTSSLITPVVFTFFYDNITKCKKIKKIPFPFEDSEENMAFDIIKNIIIPDIKFNKDSEGLVRIFEIPNKINSTKYQIDEIFSRLVELYMNNQISQQEIIEALEKYFETVLDDYTTV